MRKGILIIAKHEYRQTDIKAEKFLCDEYRFRNES